MFFYIAFHRQLKANIFGMKFRGPNTWNGISYSEIQCVSNLISLNSQTKLRGERKPPNHIWKVLLQTYVWQPTFNQGLLKIFLGFHKISGDFCKNSRKPENFTRTPVKIPVHLENFPELLGQFQDSDKNSRQLQKSQNSWTNFQEFHFLPRTKYFLRQDTRTGNSLSHPILMCAFQAHILPWKHGKICAWKAQKHGFLSFFRRVLLTYLVNPYNRQRHSFLRFSEHFCCLFLPPKPLFKVVSNMHLHRLILRNIEEIFYSFGIFFFQTP